MKGLRNLALFSLVWLTSASAAPVHADDAPTILRDVIYGHKAGMALTYDVIKPTHPNGAAVLFMVSGGWVSSWFPPENLIRPMHKEPNQFELLVDHGYTLFLIRHGSSPYFKVPDAVSDVRRAVRFVRLHAADYGIDPQRIGVFGASAGGHLSLMLGTTGDDGLKDSKDPVEQVSDRVQAVVSIFPPTRIEEFFPLKDRFPALDFPTQHAAAVSPLLQVSSDDAPTLLVHGDKDDLVPLSNSERMHTALQQIPVPTELIVVKGAGHGFAGKDQEQCQQALLRWFDKYLAPAAATPQAP